MAKKTARENHSDECFVNLDTLYARGAFKLVYKGTYSSGPRKDEEAAVKVFASGGVYENSFFQSEMDVINASMNIIEQYNKAGVIDRHIYLNQPTIWTFTGGSRVGQKALVEPFIENFQKFNSNTGWKDPTGTPWSLVMQSLSHFSYHSSGGRLVLCDLQGGIYSDGAVLTDPVVMSADQKYGPTDLGREGIVTFFARHVCNQYCRSSWTKPHNPVAHFQEQKGTSMMIVPTRSSRTPLTHWS
jgi:hypothetical protein